MGIRGEKTHVIPSEQEKPQKGQASRRKDRQAAGKAGKAAGRTAVKT